MSSQGVLDSSGDGSGLVTGDAVIVDLRLAKLPSRSLAFLLDLTIQLGAFAVLALVVAFIALGDAALTLVVVFVSSVAIIVGYPATMETVTRGRTVGKLALGLRAVRSDGGTIRFRHALVRALAAVVEIYLCSGAIAVITSLLSPEGKRVGDYMAGTIVVRERAPTMSDDPAVGSHQPAAVGSDARPEPAASRNCPECAAVPLQSELAQCRRTDHDRKIARQRDGRPSVAPTADWSKR